MPSLRHRKKRNSGLVYELLIKHLSAQIVEKDQKGSKKTLDMIRRYYSGNQPLAQERELFEAIRVTRGVPESVARKIIQQLQTQSKKLNRRKIEYKKSSLIKEINYSFGKDFYNVNRVPEYRLLASIQIMIDEAQNGSSLTESIQKFQIEEGLVRYMMSAPGMIQESVESEDKIDDLVATFAMKRFSDKYGSSLNENQKRLLGLFINAEMNNDHRKLEEYIRKEASRISKILVEHEGDKEFSEDSLMAERLNESRMKLNSLIESSSTKSPDDVLEDLLLFQKLAHELSEEI
jgi:hypothetical protein